MYRLEVLAKPVQHLPALHSLFLRSLEHWHTLGYLLIAVGIFLEGDAVLFTAGFLVHQKVFHPLLAFFWLTLGGVFGDLAWYQLGVWLEPKDNALVRWLKKMTDPLGPHLLTRPKLSLFLSKFVYGVNHAILEKAGALRLPIKKFMTDDLPGNLVWILVIGGLGYASSTGLVHFALYIRYVEIGLLLCLLLLSVLMRLVSKLIKRFL